MVKLDFNNINAEIEYNAFQVDGLEDEALNDIYLELYELIGKEDMLKLFTHFTAIKLISR